MRQSAFLLSLCLIVGLAAALDPPSPVEKPWDTAMIERLPEAYRGAVRQYVTVEERRLPALREISDGEHLFSLALSGLAERPEGMKFLLEQLKVEPSVDRKVQIVESISRAARASADSRKLLEDIAVSDSSAEVSAAALDALLENERRRMLPLIKSRIERAKQHNDVAGANLLWRKHADFAFGRVTVPEFAYRAPEVFRAAAPDAQSIRVLAFGDFGSGDAAQMQTAAAMRAYHQKMPYTFGITVGDNFYPTGLSDPEAPRWRTDWENPYGPLGVKFYASLGNHDYAAEDGPAAEIAYGNRSPSWRMPAPFYSFTAGPAQFFAIDTMRLDQKQLDWLQQGLARSSARWKIVYGHYQMYSAGGYGDNDMSRQDLIDRLLPVLKKGKADMYLCGHEHNMQELKPEDGVHFFVVGSGGAGLYETQKDHPRSIFASRAHGFGVLDITSDKAVMSFIGLDGRKLHRREIAR